MTRKPGEIYFQENLAVFRRPRLYRQLFSVKYLLIDPSLRKIEDDGIGKD